MSFHHFFLDGQIIAEETAQEFPVRLSAEDAKHARVLRLSGRRAHKRRRCGERIILNWKSHRRMMASWRRASAAPRCARRCLRARCSRALAKGDKMDDIIRHATEVALSEFVPLSSSRCVVKLDAKKAKSKLARWQAIAHSAAMQSGRMVEPRVHASRIR